MGSFLSFSNPTRPDPPDPTRPDPTLLDLPGLFFLVLSHGLEMADKKIQGCSSHQFPFFPSLFSEHQKNLSTVGDIVRITNSSQVYSLTNVTANPEHQNYKPTRYEGLPERFYTHGGDYWPDKQNPTSGLQLLFSFNFLSFSSLILFHTGWSLSNFVVEKGMEGEIVKVWMKGEGGVPEDRILIEVEFKEELFYVPMTFGGAEVWKKVFSLFCLLSSIFSCDIILAPED